MLRKLLIRTGFAASLVALSLPAVAQSYYGVDSLGGGGNALAVELTGPSVGPCGYPNGPFGLPPFPAGPGPCPTPPPFGGWPGLDGDIAVNKIMDTVWIAGPNEVAEYDTAGAPLSGFTSPLPGALTSLGMDSLLGELWLADGGQYVRVQPGCPVPIVTMGPFANPRSIPMTDLSWDPGTATLWACYQDGIVANFTPGGAITCSFDALPVGLAPPLTGLAVDTSTPGITSPNLVVGVTDGNRIARLDAAASCGGTGVLAGPTFAHPAGIWNVAGGQISGLAYAAHGVTFGGGTGPAIALGGHAIPGLATTTVELSGASAGTAGLFLDFAFLCPAGVFKGLPLSVPPAILIGPIPHAGSLTLPATIPPTSPLGVEAYMQWFNKTSAGTWESTPGMVVTTAGA